jgi:hypothetical protein
MNPDKNGPIFIIRVALWKVEIVLTWEGMLEILRIQRVAG